MRDESYEAGYRAGHLQGWLDAMAKQEASQRMAAGPDLPASATASQWQATTAHPAATAVPAAAARPERRSGTASPVPLAPPRPAETPAEQRARREKRDRQNINITLYVASLLLVAAAALFIGTNLPPMFRFVGVCAVTAMFYSAGFVLHAKVSRLRPAAVAFAGTGLALVPVTGLALYNFALHHGPAAWLITSLIGTAAYVVAAVRLESRVLVYLSLTFIASTAWSGVSVLGGALVWYFAVLIGVAVLLSVLAKARPGWLPPVYVRPLMVLHPFVVPAVALAATCVPLLLEKGEYALIIGMCGAYFALMAAAPDRLRLVNFYAARITLTVAAAVEVWDLTGRGHDALLALAGLLAVQAITVASLRARLSIWFPEPDRGTETPANRAGAGRGRGRWSRDALVTFGAQLAATMAFAVHVIFAEFYRNTGVEAGSAVPLWVPVLLALATGMVLAGKMTGPAEWAPVAALTLAGLVGDAMGAWPLAGMLVLSAAFWAVRGILSAGNLRGRMVLAGRAAITLAVPVTVAAVVDEGPGRAAAAGFGLLLALVCQQIATAVLERSAVRTLAPEASVGVFAAAGAVTLVVLPFVGTDPDSGLTGAAALIQLLAALAIGWLLIPRPATERDWHATVWEALPLGLSAVAVTVAFQAVSQGAGNGALLLVAGYLVATARRLRVRQHRWTYWWLGRGTATVLVLAAFDQLQQDIGPLVIADEVLHPATVLVTTLALQLVFPLLAAARRQAPRWILADAGAVLLLQLIGGAFLALLETAVWQGTYTVVAVAVGAAAMGYFLRAEDGSEWFAPAAFGVLLVFTDGGLAEVELLLAIFAVFCALMVVAASQAVGKGWYFVAARVLTAGLAVVLSYDVTASPTAVSLAFALVLAAQHAVRWAMRSRLAEVPFQQAAVWITLAGQALLPLAYVLQPASVRVLEHDDGGRWVVLLELFLLLVSAVVARKFFTARGALYFAVFAALFGVLSLGPLFRFGGSFLAAPVLDNTGTAAVLLSVALAAAAGALLREQNASVQGIEHWLWLGTAGSFSFAGLLVSPWAADWVMGWAVLVLSAVLFTASHVEGLPLLYPLAAAAGLAGSIALAEAAFHDIPGVWDGFLPWLVGAGLAAVALYSLRVYRRRQLQDDPLRSWSLAGTAFLGLCLVALAGVRHDATSWPAAAVLAAAVAVLFLEVPPMARRVAGELGALALTAAVQRAAIFELDGKYGYEYALSAHLPDPFWVVQWYVVLAAGLGALRYESGHQLAGRLRVGAGAGLLSLSGLGVVFGGTDGQQLWVLVLLAGLLLVGLGLGDRVFVWWGAAGVAACIMWAIRQYTFALLALIAVGLIVFAVRRLNRGTATEVPDAPSPPDGPDPDGSWPDGPEPGSSGSHEPGPHRPGPHQSGTRQPVPHQPGGGTDPFIRP